MSTGGVAVAPATAQGFETVEHALTGGGDGGSCWCRWLLETAPRSTRRPASSVARPCATSSLRRPSHPGSSPWSTGRASAGFASRRPAQAGVLRTRIARSGSDEPAGAPDVWAITCFVVRREHRGAGVAKALLDAAVRHAVDHGARVIEGYPVDRAERPRATSAELWHGTVGLFARAGFEETSRPTPARAVMTLRP